MKYEKILKNIILTAIFVIPFIPLVVASPLFFPYIVGKNILFRVLVEIMVGLWAVLALFNEKYRPKFSWILASVVALVSVMFVADALGENPLKSFWSNYERMEGWVTLLHLLGYFVVMTSVLNTEKLWKRFFNTSLAVSVWVGFYGIFQMLGWANATQGVSRLDISFGNASYLAIYAVFHIFLALFLLVRRKKWNDLGGYLYSGIILLNTCILYHTATRGAILGFLGAVLVIVFFIAVFEKEKKSLRKISIGVLVATTLFLGSFVALKNASFIKNSEVLNRFATISLEETTTKSRFMIWNMAWQGAQERPLLGWGQENFNYVFNEYYNPGMYGQEEWFDRTHNVFMDWLIVGGFLGLLAYLSLFGTFLYYLWSGKFDNGFSVFEKSIFTGLLAGYFVHNLFVFDNITSYILFFTVLAFIHNQINSPKIKTAEEKNVFIDKLNEDTRQMIAIGLVFLMFFSIYFFNVKGLLANKNLLSALSPQTVGLSENLKYFEQALSYDVFANQEIREQLMQFTLRIKHITAEKDVQKKMFDLAKAEVKKEIARDPQNARTEVLAGSFLASFGDSEALGHFERALELSPKKQSILFGMGSIYLNSENYDKAFEIFKKAYELELRYDEAKKLYALSAIYVDKGDVVEELFADEIIVDQNFLNAYRKMGQTAKVVQICEAFVGQDPNNPQYHMSLAAAYFDDNQKTKSIAEIERVIELNPDFKNQGEQFIQKIRSGGRP
ncbi:MAG: O-antigen ligase family protein [Patescibacteria group bacterium]